MIKEFRVDWDNPSDLKKHISKLQIRRKKLLENLGYKEVNFAGTKYNYDSVMPELIGMLRTDLSSIYLPLGSADYYVYFHCLPEKLDIQNNLKHLLLALEYNITNIPFYVGKGIGDRYTVLNRNDSHRKVRQKVKSSGQEIIPVKVVDGLTENEALALESKLIDILGLISYSKEGMLVNLDEGINKEARRALYSGKLAANILKKNGF